MLPVDVLTDLVRSYTSQAASVVPQFLQASFDMLRDGQTKAMENIGKASPIANMPGFDAMRAQQEAFFKAMTGGLVPGAAASSDDDKGDDGDLNEIKNQLAALQEKLSKMGK